MILEPELTPEEVIEALKEKHEAELFSVYTRHFIEKKKLRNTISDLYEKIVYLEVALKSQQDKEHLKDDANITAREGFVQRNAAN